MIGDPKSSFSSLRRAVAAALLAAPALASEFSVEAQSADVRNFSHPLPTHVPRAVRAFRIAGLPTRPAE